MQYAAIAMPADGHVLGGYHQAAASFWSWHHIPAWTLTEAQTAVIPQQLTVSTRVQAPASCSMNHAAHQAADCTRMLMHELEVKA